MRKRGSYPPSKKYRGLTEMDSSRNITSVPGAGASWPGTPYHQCRVLQRPAGPTRIRRAETTPRSWKRRLFVLGCSISCLDILGGTTSEALVDKAGLALCEVVFSPPEYVQVDRSPWSS
ncbi:hypothetical protein F4680DRAFT_444204 [Xylaria scruposa]|nr:hypothetical protein F4680DRAFT_444204 [Xylaria scruposa]